MLILYPIMTRFQIIPKTESFIRSIQITEGVAAWYIEGWRSSEIQGFSF